MRNYHNHQQEIVTVYTNLGIFELLDPRAWTLDPEMLDSGPIFRPAFPGPGPGSSDSKMSTNLWYH